MRINCTIKRKDGTKVSSTLEVKVRKEVDLTQIETQVKSDYGLDEELNKLALRRHVAQ